MQRGTMIVALFAASLPLSAGTVFPCSSPAGCFLNPTLTTPTDLGTYLAGTVLLIGVTGQVNLNGPGGSIITNPDGSLINPALPSCLICWFGDPGYTYFLQNSTLYPTTFGGDGTNHFVGGGGNYDIYPGTHAAFAAEGAQTTNTQDPNAIRFGAVAYTFLANPGPTDWHTLGFGGTFTVPNGAADLEVIVVDTFYGNNTDGFNVSVDPVPEPTAMGLALSGFLMLGGVRLFRARRLR